MAQISEHGGRSDTDSITKVHRRFFRVGFFLEAAPIFPYNLL